MLDELVHQCEDDGVGHGLGLEPCTRRQGQENTWSEQVEEDRGRQQVH